MHDMKTVYIYSTPTCHYCKVAKDFLTKNNIAYTEYDVAVDLEKRKEMVDKTGQMGVPVLEIDGKIVIGFNQTKIAELLEIAQ